jgi:uncharacterized protein (DUF1810 family)
MIEETDPHHLRRFVEAQDRGGTYEQALGELRAGRKTSHWMWFVFPQVAGLGHSEMAQRYAIASFEEARAYLAHPVLGPRLLEATHALTAHADQRPEAVLGGIDALKLRSSLTLFARAAPEEPVFGEVLEQWYDGQPDAETERRL